MFTGIVKRLAPVTAFRADAAGARIALDLGPLADTTARGDSVAVNGVCLTVAAKSGTVCEFDAVRETLSRTTLGELRVGRHVNVEPSLRVGDPLGGHFVMGHVDGVGRVADLDRSAQNAVIRVSCPADLTAQMVPKGSVTLDGIGLTLVDVGDGSFTCALIPTTLTETSLGQARPDDRMNVETDMLAKLVRSLLEKQTGGPGVTLDKLRETGFA